MVQILAGEKGEGKTKILIDLANESVSTSDGDVIYIDDDKRHIYDLNHKIRFVEVSEFPLATNLTYLASYDQSCCASVLPSSLKYTV